MKRQHHRKRTLVLAGAVLLVLWGAFAFSAASPRPLTSFALAAGVRLETLLSSTIRFVPSGTLAAPVPSEASGTSPLSGRSPEATDTTLALADLLASSTSCEGEASTTLAEGPRYRYVEVVDSCGVGYDGA